MSEAIYAKPDMNKKFNRGEMEEKMVDIYVNADTLRDGDSRTKTHETEDTAADNGPRDQSLGDIYTEAESSMKRFRVSAVCLGLLCVLILARIIVLSVYCEFLSYVH
ncbi:hypothetical protein UPYG_G00271960 [Umbra pygmaea]|uniref:Uncharacterized protein n=1 Tax=Umbra pygmaea TaxID=75934 RepID=A0ABD0WFX2_UMBPY